MTTGQAFLFQVLPLLGLGVVAFFAFSRAKKLKQQARASAVESTQRFQAEFRAMRRPGEDDAAFVFMATRNLLKKSRALYVALTNQRLFLVDLAEGSQLRVFERDAVSLTATEQRWADAGNVQTTISEGWEVTITLPQGEVYSGLRLYASDPHRADQETSVPRFLAALGH